MNIDQYMRENHPELEKMIGEVLTSEDFNCPHCEVGGKGKILIGWYQGYSPYPYGVFECQECFEKFRYHVGLYGFKPLEDFVNGIKRVLVIQNGGVENELSD